MARSPTLLLLALLYVPGATAWESVTGSLVIACRQPEFNQLGCEYRAANGGPTQFTLITDTGSVEPGQRIAFPWPGAHADVLLLVDTSDPGRAPVLQRNIEQVRALGLAARPHQRVGLAAFDRELEVLSPLGTGAEAAAAAQRLVARGLTTELYRSTLAAVRLLAASESERHFIVLFSDGQAEDTAYFHDDVVAAARADGISIVGLGFPRSVGLSVALQSLRRLSEETGGLYLEADLNGNLPGDWVSAVLGSVDDGGRVQFALPRHTGKDGGSASATLIAQRGSVQTRHEIPIRKPVPPKPPETRPTAMVPVPQAVPPELTQPRRPDAWIWYGIPALLLVLVLIAIATLVMLMRQSRRGPAREDHPAAQLPRPFAYLISQSSHPKRFPVLGAIWRIGRSRENELVLEDISVSRRHAEIQRGTDGHFTLVDRGSRNGVFVNGRQVRQQVLTEGDMIEVGDVVLRFTEMGADEQLQDPTAMQHTRQPRVS